MKTKPQMKASAASLFDASFPPPEPEGLGRVEVGVETQVDGSRLMTVATIAADGTTAMARLTEKAAVRLMNEIGNRQFLAWPMVKG